MNDGLYVKNRLPEAYNQCDSDPKCCLHEGYFEKKYKVLAKCINERHLATPVPVSWRMHEFKSYDFPIIITGFCAERLESREHKNKYFFDPAINSQRMHEMMKTHLVFFKIFDWLGRIPFVSFISGIFRAIYVFWNRQSLIGGVIQAVDKEYDDNLGKKDGAFRWYSKVDSRRFYCEVMESIIEGQYKRARLELIPIIGNNLINSLRLSSAGIALDLRTSPV